jgi:hypothetical protein
MESTNSYQLKQQEDNYILSITMLEGSIKISCGNSSGQIYSQIFALSDLKTKEEIFQPVQNAFDVVEIFDYILKNEKVKVVEEQSGVMQILLYLASEDRTIELTLEKETGGNAKEEQGFNNEMEANENNMEQNAELNGENNVNYYQNLNANVDTGLNVDVNANENVETNYEEYNANNVENNVNVNNEQFNMEEFLKNSQPEVNANETNFQMDNNNYNYVQNENINVNNEFGNINVANTENITNNANTETTSNNFNINNKIYYSFGQASENVANTANIENANINSNANTESYNNFTTTQTTTQTTQTNVNTNVFPQPKQEKQNMYSIPYITPADEVPKPQPQPQVNQTQKVQIPEYSEYSSSMSKISTAKVVPAMAQTTTTTTKTTFNAEKSLQKPKLEPKLEKYHEVSLSLPKDKKPDQDEQRINKLQGEQSSLKNQHSVFNNKITELTNLIKSYRSKITVLQSQKNASEIESLRAENQRIKQQLGEIGRLRKEVAEAQYLRNQLGEYEILRQKAAQVDSMKNQLSEINSLKMKIAELSGMRNRLDEIKRLKEEINRLNSYSANVNEINNLKAQIMNLENLRQQQHQKSQAQSQSQTLTQKTETKMTKSIIKGDIIHNLNELEMLTRKINKSNNKIILNLLYKATADSDNASAFHQKCDKAESTLVLVESDKGKRFGGFTSKNWRGDCVEKKDSEAFVFSLDTMKIYDIIEGEDAIGCYPQCGPVFMGCQIRIFDNAFKKGGTTFERNVNYETEEDFELAGGERAFGVKEIEVYEVIVE